MPRSYVSVINVTSQIFVLQCVDRIVLLYLIHCIEHGDKHDQKHAADGDGDAVPRNVKAAVNGLDVDPPDDPGHGQRGRETPTKPSIGEQNHE